jgi:hypothetical protein
MSEHRILERILEELRALRREVARPTPTRVSFQEITMLPPVAGNTQVWTGSVSPSGSAFSAGTTFTAVSSDPNAATTLDSTGLVLSIAYGSAFVDNPASPFNVVWTASGITPVPSTSPTSLTVTITPSIPTPPTPTPTSVTFAQTT